ncbi:MAG: caspase family protein [Deltaproteobacteria bacterium]|nr:caspase family protein [Deltaproteobacteria bacterium]
MRSALAVLAVASMLVASHARAETRRLALVVGNDVGNVGVKPLRYAQSDAAKFARVLSELGGVQPDDLMLLQGQGAQEVDRALTMLGARVSELHRLPLMRVVLIFYFSGHSDGAALELGHDRLAFGDLKRALAATGAEVRIAIVDACQSGGLLGEKGGSAGPGFAVNLADDLDAKGSVFLTSSASSEYALESAEVQGSYFTHHFVSGLRGAADASGDGRVTLSEAYRYAFDRTVAATAQTTVGPQHPRYDYALSGQGELVLTELRDRPTAALILPEGLQRALVVDVVHDQVVAEVGPGAPTRLTLAPGSYGIRVWKPEGAVGERLELRTGEERRIGWDELAPAQGALVAAKGNAAVDAEVVERPAVTEHENAPTLGFVLSAGLARGFESNSGNLVALRLGIENPHPSGIGLVAESRFGNESAARETDVAVHLQLRLGAEASRARLFVALEAGPGFIVGRRDASTFAGPVLELGPRVGVRFALSHRLFLTADLEVYGGASYYLHAAQVSWLPAGQLGLEWDAL